MCKMNDIILLRKLKLPNIISHQNNEPKASKPTTTSAWKKGIDVSEHTTSNNEVAIEFSRKREHEHGWAYKNARQSRQQSVRIQSVLCKVACEENSRGLKIVVVKI